MSVLLTVHRATILISTSIGLVDVLIVDLASENSFNFRPGLDFYSEIDNTRVNTVTVWVDYSELKLDVHNLKDRT